MATIQPVIFEAITLKNDASAKFQTSQEISEVNHEMIHPHFWSDSKYRRHWHALCMAPSKRVAQPDNFEETSEEFPKHKLPRQDISPLKFEIGHPC